MPKKFQWINMYKSYVWAGFYEKQFPDQIFRFGSQWTASPLLDVCARTFFLTSFTTTPTTNKCWGFPSCIVNNQVFWYIDRRSFYKNELYVVALHLVKTKRLSMTGFWSIVLGGKIHVGKFIKFENSSFSLLGVKNNRLRKEKLQ